MNGHKGRIANSRHGNNEICEPYQTYMNINVTVETLILTETSKLL